ncbi:hypothetical protein HYT23_03005 [Candidatus Pacearchaeota archaeon]|nr:hypothetical protein [Candidatus Pacearchaeota archaeon]
MKIGAYLTGSFGQSQELYKARNEWKRGRGSEEKVNEQAKKDAQQIIKLQKEAGLDFIIDPMFHFYYLFQPFSENVAGVSVGPQENWFNNNVFYWRPRIEGPLEIQTGFTKKYLHTEELLKNGSAMAILPSPYSLLVLSDVKGYKSKEEAVTNLGEILLAEAQNLVSKGYRRVQYDEPAIAVKQSLGALTKEDLHLLRRGIGICGKVNGATTSLNTYFGNAGQIISHLLQLPIDCIGIDGTETSINDIIKHNFSGKELTLGFLDARNTSLENPQDILESLKLVENKTNPVKLWLTPNAGTEYRGFTHGIKKLELLAKVKEMYNE